MKKKIILFPILFVTFFIYGQNDTIFVSTDKFDTKIEFLINKIDNDFDQKFNSVQSNNSLLKADLLDSLKQQNQRLNKLDGILSLQNNVFQQVLLELKSLKDSISSIELKSSKQIIALEELLKEKVKGISSEQLQLKDNLGVINKKTTNKFENLSLTISSKVQWGYLLIFGCILLALGLFYLIRKKVSDTSTKLDNQLEITSKKLESEQLKLDQKLIELYESKLVTQKAEIESSQKKDKDIDHSLALKVGDEIIRMRKNISSMPVDTKGLKQLSKALQRIQDTFKVNGYEMIEMLDKPYNEGMKVVANFVPDDNLEAGQQIITRIIKPQVNFNGVMVQSAQIEVSIGE
tara:strand:+ start:1102 stop:2145 length:1044 start_codon:yes stop_codon:yes gene_type:complete